jgi:hypothetical protein
MGRWQMNRTLLGLVMNVKVVIIIFLFEKKNHNSEGSKKGAALRGSVKMKLPMP